MGSGTLAFGKFLWRCAFYSFYVIVISVALAEEQFSVIEQNMFPNNVLVQNSSALLVKCNFSWKKYNVSSI